VIHKASIRFIGNMLLKSLRAYYVIVLIILIGFIAVVGGIYLAATSGGTIPGNFSTNIHFSGVEITTIIFIFVVGLTSFRDPFRMLLQNGASRNNFFVSLMVSSLGFAGVAALVDTVIGLIATPMLNSVKIPYITIFEMLYNNLYVTMPLPVRGLYTLVFLLAFYLMVFMGGHLISSLFFRLNKAAKIGFAISVPCLVFWILPLVDVIFLSGRITMFIFDVIKLALGLFDGERPYIAVLSACTTALICGAASFLLQRRAALKE